LLFPQNYELGFSLVKFSRVVSDTGGFRVFPESDGLVTQWMRAMEKRRA
jgi:hypothetical protein